MGLKNLPIHEMVKVTSSWVKKGHRDREILSRHPSLAVLLPEVDSAHYELVYSQPEEWITGQLDETDELPSASGSAPGRMDIGASGIRPHDILRGIWYRCMAEEHLTTYPEVKAALYSLRTALLPHGPESDDIATADLARAQGVIDELSIKDRQLLSRLGTLQGTLWDSVQEYLRLVGQKAGQHGRIPSRSSTRPGTQPNTREDSELSSSKVLGPRERWIRVVNRVRTVASVLISNDTELKALIQRVRQAEGSADQRGPSWKRPLPQQHVEP